MGRREEHRYFDKEFKYEAVRLLNEGNRSVKDIAGDINVHPNLLHQWRRNISQIWDRHSLARVI